LGREEAAFRGSVLRAYLETLRSEGTLDRIVARLDGEVRALVAMPPTSAELVPARVTNALIEAYYVELGEEATRAMARRANRAGIVRIIEPIIRTALRLGGASPAAILSRLELLLRQQQVGYDLGWEGVSSNAGKVRIVSHGLEETAASMVSWEGALAIAFDLTQTEGRVRTVERRWADGRTTSTLLAQW
jgi:hypothetical protein